MKLAVIGSRNFGNYSLLENELHKLKGEITELISGGAAGADTLAEYWAELNGVKIFIFQPEWSKHGRGAGIVRNKLIIEACDYCIAFWDGASKGTAFSIDYCKKNNKKVKVIHYK